MKKGEKKNDRTYAVGLPHGMGTIGVREFPATAVLPKGKLSETMWRVASLHLHGTSKEWPPKDEDQPTANYLLLQECLGWVVLVEVKEDRIIHEVYLIKDTAIEPAEHPHRRIAFREEAQRLLALKENGGYELALDIEMARADLDRADAYDRYMAELTGSECAKTPKVPEPKPVEPSKVKRPVVAKPKLTLVKNATPPVEKQKRGSVQASHKPDLEEEKDQKPRQKRQRIAEPVDVRKVAQTYVATRVTRNVRGNARKQLANQLEVERAERFMYITQGT